MLTLRVPFPNNARKNVLADTIDIDLPSQDLEVLVYLLQDNAMHDKGQLSMESFERLLKICDTFSLKKFGFALVDRPPTLSSGTEAPWIVFAAAARYGNSAAEKRLSMMLYHMPVSFFSDPLQSITDYHVSSCPKEYLASLLIAIGVV